MSDDTLSRFVHGTVLTFGGLVLGYGSEFGARVLAARTLLVADYGTIVLASTLLGLVGTVSVFGVPVGLARELPRHDTPTDLFVGSLMFNVTVGVLISGALLLATDPLTTLLQVGESEPLIRLFVAALPFFVFLELAVGGFRGREDALGRVLIKSVSLRFLRFTGLLVALAVGLQTFWVGVVWVAPVAVAAAIGAVLLYVRTDLLSRSTVRNRRFGPIRDLYLFSFPVMLAFVLNNLIQQVDTLAIGVYVATDAVGTYDAAFTLGRLFILFSVGFGFLFLPRFSDMHDSEEFEAMADLFKQVSRWMTHLAFPVLLVVGAFPEQIIGIVFRDTYTVADLSFVLIALAFFLHAMAGPNMLGLIAIGRQKTVLLGSGIAFLTNVALNVVLIPILGITGAALASLLGFVCLNGVWSLELYRAIGARPRFRPVFLSISGTMLVFFAGVTVLPLTVGSSVVSLVATLAATAVLHLMSLFVLGGFQESDLFLFTTVSRWLPVTEATLVRVFKRWVIRF